MYVFNICFQKLSVTNSILDIISSGEEQQFTSGDGLHQLDITRSGNIRSRGLNSRRIERWIRAPGDQRNVHNNFSLHLPDLGQWPHGPSTPPISRLRRIPISASSSHGTNTLGQFTEVEDAGDDEMVGDQHDNPTTVVPSRRLPSTTYADRSIGLIDSVGFGHPPPHAPLGNEKVIDFLIDHFLGDNQYCTCAEDDKPAHGCAFQECVPQVVNHDILVDYIDDMEVLSCMSNMTTSARHQLFEGIESENAGPEPQIYSVWKSNSLATDPNVADDAEITLDIDSFLALPKSLAFVSRGLNICFCPPRTSNLSSNIHLWCTVSIPSHDNTYKTTKVPYHKVPNTYLGRVNGFSECEVFVFFPHLYYAERPTTFLTDDQLQRFMDIVISAVHNTPELGHSFHQHIPSSFDQAKHMSFARSRETGVNNIAAIPKQQALHFFISAVGLASIWNQVLNAVHGENNGDLADPVLLVSSKNMKTMFRDTKLKSLIEYFYSTWQSVFLPTAFLPNSTWIDIGKETISSSVEPETFLWRTSCLNAKKMAFTMDVPRAGMQCTDFTWAQLADVSNLTIEPGRRHPLLACGLVYSQFYSSTKEIFDSAKTYPFQDKIIEGLAIDKSLQAEWKRLGKMGIQSWNPERAHKAYTACKARVGASFKGSVLKRYGIREEHRMTLDLVLQINIRMGCRGLNEKSIHHPVPRSPTTAHPPFFVLPTATVIGFLTRNLEKYILGFEYSILKDGGKTISPHSSQMALMFLELVKSSFNASDMCRVKGLWNVEKRLPNGRVRYGLGIGKAMEERGYAFLHRDRINWASWLFKSDVRDNISIGLKSQVGNYTQAYKEANSVLEFDVISSELCTWLADEVGVSLARINRDRCIAFQIVWKWFCEHFVWEFQQDVLKACRTDILEEYTSTNDGQTPIGFCYRAIDGIMEEPLAMVKDISNGRTKPKTIVERLEHLWAFDEQEQSQTDNSMSRKWEKKHYRLRYQTGVKIWNSKLAESGWEWNNLEFFKYFIRRCHIWPNATTQKWFPLKVIPGLENSRKQYVWCGVRRAGFHPNVESTWQIGSVEEDLPGNPRLIDTRWLEMGVDDVKALIMLAKRSPLSWIDLAREYEWTWGGSKLGAGRLPLDRTGTATPVPMELAEARWS